MSFINWGHETPEQKELRKRLEEHALFQQTISKKIFEQKAAANAASAGAAGGGGGTVAELSLTLEFSSVEGAQEYVANLTSVADWNDFFELPYNGTPFTRVKVDEATITLYGGSGITLRSSLFNVGINSIVAVDDQSGCITGTGKECFRLCTSLTTISLPALTTAGNGCFYLCTALTTVSLPALTTAGDYCFYSCTALTTVSLPALETAGVACFYLCTALTTVSLLALTAAGPECFYLCAALTSISIPALETAGDYCFYSCTELTTVSLPALETAGVSCFNTCESLTSISLPSCTGLGPTVGDNDVLKNIVGNTIQLTVTAALMTNNGGNPDGDIQYLQANNTVTVTQV